MTESESETTDRIAEALRILRPMIAEPQLLPSQGRRLARVVRLLEQSEDASLDAY